MTSNTEAAKYRTERNAALKQVETLKVLLGAAGVDDQSITLAQGVLSANEISVEDGKVNGFTVTDQQKEVLNKLVAKPTPEPNKPEPKEDPEDVLVGKVVAALEKKGIIAAEKESNATVVPGGPKDPANNAKPNVISLDSVRSMTPEQINNNWESISQALESGGLKATA